jgi:hypothetical protein
VDKSNVKPTAPLFSYKPDTLHQIAPAELILQKTSGKKFQCKINCNTPIAKPAEFILRDLSGFMKTN